MKPLKSAEEIIASMKESESLKPSSSLAAFMSRLNLSDEPDVPKRSLSTTYVWGKLKFQINNTLYDSTHFPLHVPSPYDIVNNIASLDVGDALFVLLVQSPDVFQLLGDIHFFDDFKCILVNYTGERDVDRDKATMPFLRKINLPVLAYVDWDPKGLKLLHALSKQVPDLIWLGFKFSDFDDYKLPKRLAMKMTKADKQLAMELNKDDSFLGNRVLADELQLMVKGNIKAESEIVAGRGISFLEDGYLPLKLQNHHNWIRL